jgi:hypothetical protein
MMQVFGPATKEQNKMKKILLLVGLMVLVLGALGVGIVYAQGGQPPLTGMMGNGGYGWMHAYVQQAFAAQVGLTEQQMQDQLAAGKTMYQIALDNGIKQEDLVAFMSEVHREAFDKAVKDGLVTQEQADWMLQRMQNMQQGGFGPGNCPMHNGQGVPFGQGRGRDSGRMGGSWG